jgi:hypothetical protein
MSSTTKRCQSIGVAALCFIFALSCGKKPSSNDGLGSAATAESPPIVPIASIVSKILAPPSGGEGTTLFTSLSSDETGVGMVHPLDTDHSLKRLYAFGYAAGGVAIGDINGDNLPDLFFAGGPVPHRLYIQTERMRFDDLSESSGIGGGENWGTGVALADIDNDGDLDIYICNYDTPNQLFINGTSPGSDTVQFEERAKEFGLDHVDASLMPSFADIDNDGDLDLYLLTNSFISENGHPKDGVTKVDGNPVMKEEHRKYYGVRLAGHGDGFQRHEMYPVGQKDKLFRNDTPDKGGARRFTDVSTASGDICQTPGKGLSATWWDYDNDGDLDLYVGNDFEDPDHLYRNERIESGSARFTDVGAQMLPHSSWYSMGSDAADLNNDGLLDFLTVDMAATTHFGQKATMGEMGSKLSRVLGVQPFQFMRNALYINSGTSHFLEGAYLAGLANSDWSWAPKLADFDNDGFTDVFVSNGMSRPFTHSDITTKLPRNHRMGRTEWDIFESYPPQKEKNLAYANRGELKFEPSGAEWGLDHLGMSYGAAYGDLDVDGDLDLVVVNLDEPVSIYRNDASGGNRILVSLRGTRSNRAGIGSSVRIESGGVTQISELSPMTGYLSCNAPQLHFGLGDAEKIDSLTVTWPGGGKQKFNGLAANLHYEITEPGNADDLKEPAVRSPKMMPMFTDATTEILRGFLHQDNFYNDFAKQPLLPNQLSHLGPGIALGDIDRDGDDDLYLGGATDQTPMLGVNLGKEGFGMLVESGLEVDPGSEDSGALFFDADNDGDLDLYVASGSVEAEPGSPVLRDRLYLETGKANFTKAPAGTLPDLRDSSSCVTACDFDRDGDLDLFVGARSVPGQYPFSPESRLLRNTGGKFSDASDEVAPGLSKAGMVTGALWSDADDDGWTDLLVTYEWGPVRYWRNVEGKLTDATEAAGLAALTGWWNGIAGGDIDNDGDIDYAVTNFGLNTKYHASPSVPTLLYCGDFEGNGTTRLIEAEYEHNVLYPVRGKSCATRAMPHLADRFKTFHDYALAPLTKIYEQERLDAAIRFEATTLESGILINDGKGSFAFRAFPRIAQISPGFGVVLEDVNADGNLDVYLVQNFWTPQVETGRMDSGLSQLLLGTGEGGFAPVPPKESGLIIPRDAKSLVATDFNADGRVDFIVGNNNYYAQAFQNRITTGSTATVDLKRFAEGKIIPGARVIAKYASGKKSVREVYAGSGYLSQSTQKLTFGHPDDDLIKELSVRWSDGTISIHQP